MPMQAFILPLLRGTERPEFAPRQRWRQGALVPVFMAWQPAEMRNYERCGSAIENIAGNDHQLSGKHLNRINFRLSLA